ncbi:MAG: glycosyltransferase [Desulfobacteraceae bacterium]|jgi:UDP:flavonoid glycosyltransferase YjiC (YdhE family)
MPNKKQTKVHRRLLFTTNEGYGHFHPLVPIAKKARAAGHTVAFACPSVLSPVVEASGFQVFPTGQDADQDPELEQILAQVRKMPPGPELDALLWAGFKARRMLPDLIDICHSWKPDVLVRECAELGACIAAEHLGLPHAAVQICASFYIEANLKYMSKYLDPIRKNIGLAPDPELESLYRYLFLSFMPPGFHKLAPPELIPSTTHLIRPEVFDQSGKETLPEWIKNLPKQPTVYVTLGTEISNIIPGIYPHFIQTIITGLRDEDINLIVTIGRDKDPADFGKQPSNVHIERYIPNSLLLPHCDLIVMHGGSNSLIAAVDAGLPMVIVLPMIADQPVNAKRCATLNLGQVVNITSLTSDAIGDAVREVLHNSYYRENVHQLQDEMHSLPKLEYAVSLLEKLAAEKSALINAE